MTEAPPREPAAPPSVLRRSSEGRFLMGVCAGLGRHTGIDPVVFRVGFVILLFGSGIGLFLYIAAFLLMKEPSGRPGLIEQWTHRDFDADTVMALLTAVLALGLGINLSTVWLDTGTLVAGLFLAVALLAAHAHGVDLLGLVRSMPERLNRRPRAMDLDGYQETPRVPPYAQATPPMGHRPPGSRAGGPPDQPRRTDENGTREETSHPAADAAPEPGKGPRAVPLTGTGPAAVHASVSPKTSGDADRTERSQDEATATSPGTAATPDGRPETVRDQAAPPTSISPDATESPAQDGRPEAGRDQAASPTSISPDAAGWPETGRDEATAPPAAAAHAAAYADAGTDPAAEGDRAQEGRGDETVARPAVDLPRQGAPGQEPAGAGFRAEAGTGERTDQPGTRIGDQAGTGTDEGTGIGSRSGTEEGAGIGSGMGSRTGSGAGSRAESATGEGAEGDRVRSYGVQEESVFAAGETREMPAYRPLAGHRETRYGSYGEPFAPHGPYQPLDPAKRGGGYSPYDPALYGVPLPKRQKRPKSFIGAITILLATIIGGILVAVQAASPSGVQPTIVGGAVLVTIGAGLLIAAWWGKGAGLVAAGTTVALLIGIGLMFGGLPAKVGSAVWQPLTVEETRQVFDVGVGDGELDLSKLALKPGSTVEVRAAVSVGTLDVVVPPDARVEVHATNKVGDIQVDQSLRGGLEVRLDRVMEPEVAPEGEPATIVLHIRGGVGDLEVRRAA
ncbi:PspC domain-containing protein [Nonomuraea sp. C10]|uniref:PspC domain-containing protein n=1 Tax=Nonomuraea sp. C10 TaxID=2600577 RepID=UPI00165075DA|nr:PspC domain-containing protein [Nonomuraea sp. C10]